MTNDDEQIRCDTPGCGRPIPKGGEGCPEICPKCLRDLDAADESAAIWNGAPEPHTPELPVRLKFMVPGEPVPYARMMPRVRGLLGGKMVQPDKARAYQKHFATHAMLAARAQRWKRLPPKALVTLRLDIFRSARRADLSNYLKLAEDAVNDCQAIWADDRYVVNVVARMWKSKTPRIEVTIELLDESDEEEA